MSRKNRPQKRNKPGNKKIILPKKKSEERAEHKQCYLIAKKIMRRLGLAPELVDVFTKKQKEIIMRVCYERPTIKAKEERTVPSLFIRNINSFTYDFMKTNYWGDPEHKITFMELATFGLSFLGNLSDFYRNNSFLPNSPQEEAAKKIFDKVEEEAVPGTAFSDVLHDMWFTTRCLSRVNYRMYGFEFDYYREPQSGGRFFTNRLRFLITALDSESKMFTYNEAEQKAYRMFKTASGYYEPESATISSKKLFPKAADDVALNIYILSNVLHHFKERLDALIPYHKNLLIQYSFTEGIELITFDNQILFTCRLEEVIIGYFTFFVKGGDVVINAFLPLTSPNTPEGKKLQEALSISIEEMVYLGMDKSSFFTQVDFEQIPKLKQAFLAADLWPAKMKFDKIIKDKDDEVLIEVNKTKSVKSFFESGRLEAPASK